MLYLDEDTSGPEFASLLGKGRLSAREYQVLLPRNKKTPDSTVIASAAKEKYILVTTDKRLETDWIDDIVTNKAQIILLTDDDGGPMHWASALIVSENRWTRILLDNPHSPLVIRIDRAGNIVKLIGESELCERRDQLLTASIVRRKRHRTLANADAKQA